MAPNVCGSSSATMPRPFQELTIPNPSAISARAPAPAALAPLPSHSIGRRARDSRSAAASSSAADGQVQRGSIAKWSSKSGRST